MSVTSSSCPPVQILLIPSSQGCKAWWLQSFTQTKMKARRVELHSTTASCRFLINPPSRLLFVQNKNAKRNKAMHNIRKGLGKFPSWQKQQKQVHILPPPKHALRKGQSIAATELAARCPSSAANPLCRSLYLSSRKASKGHLRHSFSTVHPEWSSWTVERHLALLVHTQREEHLRLFEEVKQSQLQVHLWHLARCKST